MVHRLGGPSESLEQQREYERRKAILPPSRFEGFDGTFYSHARMGDPEVDEDEDTMTIVIGGRYRG